MPLLYFIIIPRSRLSSDVSSPSSNIGSAIDTVVELTVVVVPATVRLPPIVTCRVTSKSLVTVKSLPIVTSLGNPTVTVPFERETSVSLAVPAIASTAPVVAFLSVTAPELTSKSPLSNDATPLTVALAGSIVASRFVPVNVVILIRFDDAV